MGVIYGISVIRQELRFPLDAELQGKITLTSNYSRSTLEYLHLTHTDRSFVASILRILIKDRVASHVEYINHKRNIQFK